MYAELHRTYGIRKDDFIPRGPILLPLNSGAGLSLVATSTCEDKLGSCVTESGPWPCRVRWCRLLLWFPEVYW